MIDYEIPAISQRWSCKVILVHAIISDKRLLATNVSSLTRPTVAIFNHSGLWSLITFKLRLSKQQFCLTNSQDYPGVDYTHLVDHIQPTYDNNPEFN